jgi:hypothetical protein
MVRGMGAVLVCPKCGAARTRKPNGRGYQCVSCERERKRTYKRTTYKRMVAQRKAAAVPTLPEAEPVPVEPAAARESAVILGLHYENLSALTASLAEVTRLRERGAVLGGELSSQSALIDGLAEELLAGQPAIPTTPLDR